jgi:Plant transposon protein
MSSSSDSSDGVGEQIGDALMAAVQHSIGVLQAQMGASSSSSRRPKRPRSYIPRDREDAHDRLVRDYFADDCAYPPGYFRRRYRMRRSLFLHIMQTLGARDEYFTDRIDALGRRSLSPIQKCTAALRQLAYGSAADSVDEYVKLGKSTALECLEKYCEGIIECFGTEFLRRPNIEDRRRLLAQAEERGFPGMLGSIDCMHWQWHNCPVGWQGQFTRGDIKHPTIILEAVASYDRWIWHAFFGVAGSNNDINVLNQSPLFVDAIRGNEPQVTFTVNGNEYNMGYYLADGIYPSWPVFMKGVPVPQADKHRFFSQRQASLRKDVECAFGLLKKRFNILAIPGRSYSQRTLGLIMRACVILHNMIIDDQRGGDFDENYQTVTTHVGPAIHYDAPPSLATQLMREAQMTSTPVYAQLQMDLIEHVWNKHHQ